MALTIIVGLVLLWFPRLWFLFADPEKLREFALQTPIWMPLLSVVLIVTCAFFLQSAGELLRRLFGEVHDDDNQ